MSEKNSKTEDFTEEDDELVKKFGSARAAEIRKMEKKVAENRQKALDTLAIKIPKTEAALNIKKDNSPSLGDLMKEAREVNEAKAEAKAEAALSVKKENSPIPFPSVGSGSATMGLFLLFLAWGLGAWFSFSTINELKEIGLPDGLYGRLLLGAIMMFFHSLLLLAVIRQNSVGVRALHDYLRAKNSQ